MSSVSHLRELEALTKWIKDFPDDLRGEQLLFSDPIGQMTAKNNHSKVEKVRKRGEKAILENGNLENI